MQPGVRQMQYSAKHILLLCIIHLLYFQNDR